jgi:GWxTD domain-containing protein
MTTMNIMSRRLGTLIVLLAMSGLSVADDRVKKLTPEHREWLEEEVVYIITDPERDVFLSLETVEERARFIDAFWDRRDPDRATDVNEFKEEHYKRLDHATRIYGRDAARPGWKTDRGRFYIILGPPREIQYYDGLNDVVSTELWFYNGDPKYGLPPRFNLVFFKPQDIGEYELYSPLGDGPEALLRAGSGPSFRLNQHLAVDTLEIASMELARASLTVDLTEPVGDFVSARNTRQPMTQYVRPPINVEMVIANIEESSRKRVDTGYLDGYLRYKDLVSADYSFRFVPSRQFYAVLAGPENTPFVHYSVEIDPEHFSLQATEDGTKFQTTLDVTVEIRDEAGTLVVVSEHSPFIELSASQMRAVASSPFAYQDDFPLLPGKYRVSLVVRNRVTKQFTAADQELTVEPLPDGPGLTGMVLGHQTELVPGDDNYRVFQVGHEIVYPASGGGFTASDSLYVLAQTWQTTPEHKLRMSVVSEQKSVLTRDVPLTGEGSVAAVEEFALTGIENGQYVVRVELLDASGASIAERSAELNLSPRTSIPRAGFVFRHSFNAEAPGLLALARGQQYLTLGRIPEAEAAFAQAVAADNPGLVMAKWKLATVLLYSRKADEALELLLPFAESYANEPEVVEGLGLAYYMKGDYAAAVRYIEHAITLRPPESPLLNALGDSYQNLQQPEKARSAFERSLAMNPGQEAVKQRLASLGKDE